MWVLCVGPKTEPAFVASSFSRAANVFNTLPNYKKPTDLRLIAVANPAP